MGKHQSFGSDQRMRARLRKKAMRIFRKRYPEESKTPFTDGMAASFITGFNMGWKSKKESLRQVTDNVRKDIVPQQLVIE